MDTKMNRRDLLRGAAMAIPAAALVPSTDERCTSDCARVVWIGICNGVEMKCDAWPSVAEYVARQTQLGRDIVHIIEDTSEPALVAVEMRVDDMAAAAKFIEHFQKSCTGDLDAYEKEFGYVSGICAVGPGQVLDLLAFLRAKHAVNVSAIHRRLRKLEAVSITIE